MLELNEDNVILYSYKDVDIEKGVRYLPAIYVECEEDELDNVDLKKLLLDNIATIKRLNSELAGKKMEVIDLLNRCRDK